MAKQRVQKELKGWRNHLELFRAKRSEEYRAYLAELAGGPAPRRLARAGEYFGLNPTDPIESAVLLRILSDVLFPKKGRRKGTKEWDTERLLFLAEQVKWLEAKHPRWNDSRLAQEIHEKMSPGFYKSRHAVRQKLSTARAIHDALPRRLIAEKSEQELRAMLEALQSGKETSVMLKSPTVFRVLVMGASFAIEHIEKRLREIEAKKPALALVK